MSEALKKAKKRYQAKVKRFTVDFYPTEQELWDHLQEQPKKQTYIKSLIRADIEKEKDAQDVELTEEQKIELAMLTMFINDENKKKGFEKLYKRQIYDKQQKEKDGN